MVPPMFQQNRVSCLIMSGLLTVSAGIFAFLSMLRFLCFDWVFNVWVEFFLMHCRSLVGFGSLFSGMYTLM